MTGVVTSFIEPEAAIPGIYAIAVAGFISLFAVVGLLSYVAYKHIRRSAAERAGHQSTMGDKHMSAYFYSLLVASILKALSVIMSLRWTYMPMNYGTFCTLQSGLKLAGNVGTATWSMVIAIHIFNLLFMALRPSKWSLPAVVGGVWSFILADVLIGPVAFREFFVPYDGGDGDGTSCWISRRHTTAHFLLEYLPTGLAVTTSILLLTATLLYLRGNILYVNRRIKLRLRLHGDDAWHNEQMRDDLDQNILSTVKRMIWFPSSYFVLWMPVVISRLVQSTHKSQPYAFVVFSLTVYALTGFTDVVLFVLTRKFILRDGVVAPVCGDLEKERAAQDGALPGSIVAPVMKQQPLHKKGVSGQISLPRPLVLQAAVDGVPLSRTSSSTSDMSYKSTTGLLTGSTMPHFAIETPVQRPPPPPPMMPSGLNLPPLVPIAPPKRMSDVSMIASTMSPATAFSGTDTLSSFYAGSPYGRTTAKGRVGIGALQNGPKLSRTGSASSTTSSIRSESNYSSPSGASRAAPAQTLELPTASTFAPATGTYTAQAHILSAYGNGNDDRLTAAAPVTAVSSNESFVGGAPSAMPSTRGASVASGGTFGAAYKAAAKQVVAPVTSDETFKAQLYGARFSLVAGPAPSYNLNGARQV